MNGPDTHALSILLEREEKLRDEARLAQQRALEGQSRAAHQLQLLINYRSDYIARWSAQFRQSAGPEIVQVYRNFMLKLDQAIEQQRGAVKGAEAQAERCRSALVAVETRAAAVRKLIERREAEHARRLDARARKEMDEIGQRVGWQAARRGALGALGALGAGGAASAGADSSCFDDLHANSAFLPD